MRGEFGKELRFKEMGLFSIDLNGEYSANRRYLTVERLDMRWGLVFLSRIDSLKQSLKSLARLANLLGRTAVLPPFPCRREDGEAQFCNLCHFDLPNCFKGVLGQFRSPVRESVFFTNPLVPEAIRREERSNPIYSFSRNCKTTTRYESSFPPRFNHNSSVICVPCSASIESCAYNAGRTVNSRVFRVLSLFPVCSIPLQSIILLFPH